jgi:hypothetical protein
MEPVKNAIYVDATFHTKYKTGWFIVTTNKKILYHSPRLYTGGLKIYEYLACIWAINFAKTHKRNVVIYTSLLHPISWINAKKPNPWNTEYGKMLQSLVTSAIEYNQTIKKHNVKFYPFIWGRNPAQKFLFQHLQHKPHDEE